MIKKTINKLPLFVNGIAVFLCGNNKVGDYDEAEDLWYFGEGYWRGKAVRKVKGDMESPVIGIRLINPDKTGEQIEAVEKAACLLGHGEYEEQPREDRFRIKVVSHSVVVPGQKSAVPFFEVYDTHGREQPPILVSGSYLHETLGLLNQRPTNPDIDRDNEIKEVKDGTPTTSQA